MDQPPQINEGQASSESARKVATEPTHRRRGRLPARNSVASKQPRLPSDALKLIVRLRGGQPHSKILTYQLLEAICRAARFTRDAVRHEDLIQANPIQNTFAYCTPDIGRAGRVLQIKAITIDNNDYEILASKKSRGSPKRSSAGSGRSTDKLRNTKSRSKNPPSEARFTIPADGIGPAPAAGRVSPGTTRAPFHRSSLPFTQGDLGLPLGNTYGPPAVSNSPELLLLCGVHLSRRHLHPSNMNINNRWICSKGLSVLQAHTKRLLN
ncbi:hypothetical protein MTO96_025860 [Rhipicephalus appendiculatus]